MNGWDPQIKMDDLCEGIVSHGGPIRVIQIFADNHDTRKLKQTQCVPLKIQRHDQTICQMATYFTRVFTKR